MIQDISHLPVAQAAGQVAVELFSEGTNALYDTFAGMVPCEVIQVFRRSLGFRVGSQDEIKIRLTKTVGAYKKGEELVVSAFRCPPKAMRRRLKFSYRVLTGYCYVTPQEMA